MPFFRFFSYSEKMGFGFTDRLMVDARKKGDTAATVSPWLK
jgi:hypothetical protein